MSVEMLTIIVGLSALRYGDIQIAPW